MFSEPKSPSNTISQYKLKDINSRKMHNTCMDSMTRKENTVSPDISEGPINSEFTTRVTDQERKERGGQLIREMFRL